MTDRVVVHRECFAITTLEVIGRRHADGIHASHFGR